MGDKLSTEDILASIRGGGSPAKETPPAEHQKGLIFAKSDSCRSPGDGKLSQRDRRCQKGLLEGESDPREGNPIALLTYSKLRFDATLQASELDPKNLKAYYRAAKAAFAVKRWDECVAYTTAGLKTFPKVREIGVKQHS